jgi:putative Holliday junction resolvase
MAIPCTLAIDPGQRRIGLAITSEAGLGARPLFTLHRSSERSDLKAIARFVRQHAVEQIIVGLPLNMDGSRGPAAEKAERFAELLRAANPGVPIHLVDERLTTAEAHERLDAMERAGVGGWPARVTREEKIDQVAAAVLLESYLAQQQPVMLREPE